MSEAIKGGPRDRLAVVSNHPASRSAGAVDIDDVLAAARQVGGHQGIPADTDPGPHAVPEHDRVALDRSHLRRGEDRVHDVAVLGPREQHLGLARMQVQALHHHPLAVVGPAGGGDIGRLCSRISVTLDEAVKPQLRWAEFVCRACIHK
jgi:hypothetical protein